MAFMVMAAQINFADCNLYPYILVFFGKPYILVITMELAAIVLSNFLRSLVDGTVDASDSYKKKKKRCIDR